MAAHHRDSKFFTTLPDPLDHGGPTGWIPAGQDIDHSQGPAAHGIDVIHADHNRGLTGGIGFVDQQLGHDPISGQEQKFVSPGDHRRIVPIVGQLDTTGLILNQLLKNLSDGLFSGQSGIVSDFGDYCGQIHEFFMVLLTLLV